MVPIARDKNGATSSTRVLIEFEGLDNTGTNPQTRRVSDEAMSTDPLSESDRRDELPAPIRRLMERRPDALRAVVLTGETGVEPLYFRADVERDVDPEQLDRKASMLSTVIEEDAGRTTPFGDLRGAVRVYDEVLILRMPTSAGSVVVSADAEGDSTVAELVRASIDD